MLAKMANHWQWQVAELPYHYTVEIRGAQVVWGWLSAPSVPPTEEFQSAETLLQLGRQGVPNAWQGVPEEILAELLANLRQPGARAANAGAAPTSAQLPSPPPGWGPPAGGAPPGWGPPAGGAPAGFGPGNGPPAAAPAAFTAPALSSEPLMPPLAQGAAAVGGLHYGNNASPAQPGPAAAYAPPPAGSAQASADAGYGAPLAASFAAGEFSGAPVADPKAHVIELLRAGEKPRAIEAYRAYFKVSAMLAKEEVEYLAQNIREE